MPEAQPSPDALNSEETDALYEVVRHQITGKTFDAATNAQDQTKLQQMVESLGDKRGITRLHFAEAIGAIGTSATRYLIEAVTHHPNPVVRRAAAKTLTLIGDPAAVPTLIHSLLNDPDTVVRTSVTGALARRTDTAGRLKGLTDGLATQTFAVNDSFKTEGVTSVESGPTDAGTTYTSTMVFDNLDRLTSIADGLDTIRSFTPRLDGLPLESRDALHNPTTFSYSKLGELLRSDRPESLRTSRIYDGNRRLTAIQDRGSKGHGYLFEDGRLRMTKQTLRRAESEISFSNPNGPGS